jgi:hypothetical protein
MPDPIAILLFIVLAPFVAACSRALGLLLGIILGLVGLSLFVLSASVPQGPNAGGGLVGGILLYGLFYWFMYSVGNSIREPRANKPNQANTQPSFTANRYHTGVVNRL